MTKGYIYILKCRDNTLYTGFTTNIKMRLDKHNDNKGAKYTRGRTPVELVYYEKYENKQLAQKREYAIKKLNRNAKLEIINNFYFSFFK